LRTCIQIRENREVCSLGNLHEFIRICCVERVITTVNQQLNALTALTYFRELDYCINVLINAIIASNLRTDESEIYPKQRSLEFFLFLDLLLVNNRYVNAEAIEATRATYRHTEPEHQKSLTYTDVCKAGPSVPTYIYPYIHTHTYI